MRNRELLEVIAFGTSILLSLLIILEMNTVGLGSANWQTIGVEMGYVSVALVFFGMGLFIFWRRR